MMDSQEEESQKTGRNEEEEFMHRISEVMENGFLTVGLHIGHKLKLFDSLHDIASKEAPKTSEELALAAQLKERSVG